MSKNYIKKGDMESAPALSSAQAQSFQLGYICPLYCGIMIRGAEKYVYLTTSTYRE